MGLKYKPPVKIDKKYLTTIRLDGLKGRLLHLPSNRKKTFIVLYGQHSSIERMYSVAEMLNEYGEVYLPDLPGFGGMTSFYKVGKTPSYDNYADYLYAFLKSKKLDKNLWFFANSFSSQVMTRMFQRHPDSVKWVKQPIAFVGLVGGDNFSMPRGYFLMLKFFSWLASKSWGSKLMWLLAFNPLSLRVMLSIFTRTKAKMQNDDDNLKEAMVQMEGHLWQDNDIRTHGTTALMMFNQDIRDDRYPKIDLNLHNIATSTDQYFNNEKVDEGFKQLYRKYETSSLNLEVHAPSMIADKAEVKKVLSAETLKLLAKT